jgi:RNA recognition motif-containing protein
MIRRKAESKDAKMGKKIYVGNLSYNTNEDELMEVFQNYGQVASCKIISDRDTGRSKGFGFVEMGTEDEARAAISSLNGTELDGRQLKVNESIDKPRY